MSETTNAPSSPVHLFWDVRINASTFHTNAAASGVDKLHARLTSLRKRYGNALLPGASTPHDMLARFCTLLFPDGRLTDYLISNITVKADPYLLIRPETLLPSHVEEWPAGLTLGAKGYVERRTGLFRLMDISDMTDLPARPFERALRAVPVRGSPRHGESVASGLNPEWLGTLPLISKDTADALKQWTDYLDWKQKLVQAGIAGIRYLSRALQEDGTWRFVVVVPEAADCRSIDRLLRSDDLCAYNLDYSTDPWIFTYRENSKARAQALGEATPGMKPKTLDRNAIPSVPTRDELPVAHFCEVSYRLEDSVHEKFLEVVEAEGEEEALKKYANTIPATGFLAVSAVGDLSLIRRQREELQRLQKESGFAPFVSAYLFDITQARVPNHWHEIASQDWLRTDMNPDQRKAVQMMVSTPDLSLIQGPPGTGKTTMIAEAVYQLIRQGKTVLVASQANLAVDNALARLGDTPAIRALRLGTKADKESPFVPERALGSYYRSVAQACRRQHLDKWETMQSEARALQDWIEATELVALDLRQAEERIAQGRALMDRSKQEQQVLQDRLDMNAAQRERLDDATSFLDQLACGYTDWSGELPDELRQPWHAAVARMQGLLAEAGLNTGRALGWYDPAASRLQSNALFSAARQCQQMLERLPSLRNELRRLSQLKTEQLMSEETEVLLAELTAERARLRVLAEEEDDDTALAKLKEIAQQLRALARDSGLARELYETVFDQAHAAKLLTSDATRTAVVEALRRAVIALRCVLASYRAALPLGRAQLAAAVSSVASAADDQRQLTQVSRGIRELEHQLAQDAQQRTRHFSGLGEQLEVDDLPADWPSACITALEARRARQSAVDSGLRKTETLRKDWAPVLETWASALDEQGNPSREGAPAVRYLTDAYIASCNVVGITCSERRSTLTDAKHDFFDVAIVDEVSKATPPELLMCISMARTAILVGDHRQLPPVFKEGISAEQYLEQVEDQEDESQDAGSDSALTRENLEKFGDMVSASLFKRHFEKAPGPLKASLFRQYRMHPQIMKVVNAFYEGKLIDGFSDSNGRQNDTSACEVRQHRLQLVGPDRIPYLEPDQHVMWIDSGKAPNGQDVFERRAGASGKVNDTEAALIAKVLADLDQACARQGYGSAGKPRKEVGIVTFYAKQIRAIRDAIGALVRTHGPFAAIKVDVNTADRYQGQERPIVIVSLVRCPPHKLSKRANTAQFERINVAFSRAQELLVILGSERIFRPYEITLPHLDRPGHSITPVYGQIIGEIEFNGGFKRARQLVDQATFEQLLPPGANGRHAPVPVDTGRKARKPNKVRSGGAP